MVVGTSGKYSTLTEQSGHSRFEGKFLSHTIVYDAQLTIVGPAK
jgi:hypothetical protein